MDHEQLSMVADKSNGYFSNRCSMRVARKQSFVGVSASITPFRLGLALGALGGYVREGASVQSGSTWGSFCSWQGMLLVRPYHRRRGPRFSGKIVHGVLKTG